MRKYLKKFFPMPEIHDNKAHYSFVFILFMATVLIFQHSWVPGMFLDGGTYATLGKNAALKGHWLIPFYFPGEMARFAEHPPLYFMFKGVLFKIFGISWTTARLSVFLLDIILLTTLWVTLKKHVHRRFAFLSLLILLLCYPFIKKSRFPNLEIPLTLFALLTLTQYYKAFTEGRFFHWLLAGLFLGCAALTKGHAAFFIILAVGFHLLLTKELKKLLNYGPWLSLITGLLIFSLWPLLLWLNNGMDVFHLWIQKQFFGTVIHSRGKQELDLFEYVITLLKECAPWFILSLISTWHIFKKEKKDHIAYLFIAWFWAVLLPYSFLRWKYSHYIIPLYPPMAVLAAYFFLTIKEKYSLWLSHGIRILTIIAALILLCFPLGTQTKRDRELLEAEQLTNYLAKKPTAWGDVDDSYGFYSFVAPLSFITEAGIYRVSFDELEKILENTTPEEKQWVFYIKEEKAKLLKEKHPLTFEKKFEILVRLPQKGDVILIEKNLLPLDTRFGEIK